MQLSNAAKSIIIRVIKMTNDGSKRRKCSYEEPTLEDAPESSWVPSITILSGRRKDLCVEVEGDSFTIGRLRKNDLVLDENAASREHAKIAFQDGRYKIKDLDSRWGTSLNGHRITESELRFGDEIEIAGVLMKFGLAHRQRSPQKKVTTIRIAIAGVALLAIVAAISLFYYRHQARHNLTQPGGDVLARIIAHYDKGIYYYNKIDIDPAANKQKAIEEMQKVIELDPTGKTRFSRGARRILDGLEE